MEPLILYVDSSFKPNGQCQCGYTYQNPYSNVLSCYSSEVFTSNNNNDSEIFGIYLSVKAIYEKYGITNFLVYNDNIIACSMLRSDKEVSKKMLQNHKVLGMVREYFKKNNLKVKTKHVGRNNCTLKLCDKASKAYRKGKRK